MPHCGSNIAAARQSPERAPVPPADAPHGPEAVKQRGDVPMATQQQLKNRVKKTPDGVTESAHQVLLAGLGVAALAEEQGVKLIDRLVAGGKEGEKVFDRLVARGRKVETTGRKRFEQGRKQVLAARTQTEKSVEKVVKRARGTVDSGLGRLAQR